MMCFMRLGLSMVAAAALCSVPTAKAATGGYHANLGKLTAVPPSWSTQGTVVVAKTGGYHGHACLRLQRTKAEHFKPTAVRFKVFPVHAGKWHLQVAMKSKLHSPDSSYPVASAGGLSVDGLLGGGVFPAADREPYRQS